MAQFSPALSYLLDFEDRNRNYTAVMDSNGGGVIAGINSKSFPRQYAAIINMSVSQRGPAVSQFYYEEFWTPLMLGGIESQDIANRVLDMSVNSGPDHGVRLLQDSVNQLQPGALVVDGKIGAHTLEAVNGLSAESVLAAYRVQRLAYYAGCADWSKPNIRAAWTARAEA